MKTLIISMTCGEGHNYIAKAIKSELDLLNEDCKIIQLYGYSDKEVQRQNKLFLNTCKYIPSLYEKIWLKLRSRNPKRPSSIVKKTIKSCDKYLLSEIEKYNPDNIICTHNNASAVISYFKKENKIPAHIKTYTIAFDYCVCPYWEFSTDCDYIITPHEFTHNEYLEKGFNSAQLLPFGLPVDEKYTKSINKQQARETLGINPEIFTVALYSGGNCLSKASKFIKAIIKYNLPIQIIAICGKNEKEFKKVNNLIAKYNLKNVLNIGFCTNLDVIYSASDIVFSRGGGMGLTEQINKNVPFVLREGLIINERINKKIFTDMGVSLSMNKIQDAYTILRKLIAHPNKLNEMRDKAQSLCKPNSTKNFINFLLKNKAKETII
ncbi:MAG: hypothetical protein E7362_05475 [Clostridiales bacterium]|nr:hypothetical protein [Clostridiales bacterium]